MHTYIHHIPTMDEHKAQNSPTFWDGAAGSGLFWGLTDCCCCRRCCWRSCTHRTASRVSHVWQQLHWPRTTTRPWCRPCSCRKTCTACSCRSALALRSSSRLLGGWNSSASCLPSPAAAAGSGWRGAEAAGAEVAGRAAAGAEVAGRAAPGPAPAAGRAGTAGLLARGGGTRAGASSITNLTDCSSDPGRGRLRVAESCTIVRRSWWRGRERR